MKPFVYHVLVAVAVVVCLKSLITEQQYLNISSFHVSWGIPLQCHGVVKYRLSQITNLTKVSAYCSRSG